MICPPFSKLHIENDTASWAPPNMAKCEQTLQLSDIDNITVTAGEMAPSLCFWLTPPSEQKILWLVQCCCFNSLLTQPSVVFHQTTQPKWWTWSRSWWTMSWAAVRSWTTPCWSQWWRSSPRWSTSLSCSLLSAMTLWTFSLTYCYPTRTSPQWLTCECDLVQSQQAPWQIENI